MKGDFLAVPDSVPALLFDNPKFSFVHAYRTLF